MLKVHEGRPHAADLIKNGEIDLVINTPLGRESFYDEGAIRKSATQHGILCLTTLTATAATVRAIRALRERVTDVTSLQEIHAGSGEVAGLRSPATGAEGGGANRGQA